MILLEKDLRVLNDGVIEGRRCFANIMKYIVMGTSSNFGNMFSMAAASLFLPFLPMLPTQILLNNFLYDVCRRSASPPTTSIAALLRRPKRWQIGFIRQFMMIIGPISSIYDFLTFGLLFWVFQASRTRALPHWMVRGIAGDADARRVRHPDRRATPSEPSEPAAADRRARRRGRSRAGLPYTPLGVPCLRSPAAACRCSATIALLADHVPACWFRWSRPGSIGGTRSDDPVWLPPGGRAERAVLGLRAQSAPHCGMRDPVRGGVQRRTPEPKVIGSSPIGRTKESTT